MPTKRVPVPSGQKIALIRVTDIPLHFYRYLYAHVGGPYHWVDRRDLGDNALSERVHRETVEISVLYADGAPAGYYELDFAERGKATLVYFGLIADFIGRGLGPYLLNETVHDAWRDGVEELAVETCTLDHPSALTMYQRAGFEPIGREERVIVDPIG